MRITMAKDTKYNFEELIDNARAAPVTAARYGRPMVVVMGVEEYERLNWLDAASDIESKVPRNRNTEKFRNGRRRD